MLGRAGLHLRTLPHLRPWQILGRIIAPLRRKISSKVEVPRNVSGHLEPSVPFLQHEPWNTRDEILTGRFCFLNRTEDLGHPIDWHPANLPLLWRFNLHYFHFVHLLEPDEQVRCCRSWVDSNGSRRTMAWHPYPTSHRIVNWCKANLADSDLRESLYAQAAHLARNLETYVYGNHLIENARALVFAGVFFDGAGESGHWLQKGLDILRTEADEQILPDGGHYERSPMYHALMLEAYADVLNILPPGDPNTLWLEPLIARMSTALHSMMHPDGDIALFNDATLEIAPPASELLTYVEQLGVVFEKPSPRRDLPATGYFVSESDRIFLMVDGGPAGPEHLMAHAHADIFSFELSLDGYRFIVDSGVYEYQEGERRDYSRSSAAHNTVAIDGQDQIECWGSFRVGRRAAPHNVRMRRENGLATFEGVFSGYGKIVGDGIEHRRSIRVDHREKRIIVHDEILGRGRHRVESRVHFHPEVTIEKGASIRLARGDAACRLEVLQGQLRWEETAYYPQFGVEQQRECAVIGGVVDLPVTIEYGIWY